MPIYEYRCDACLHKYELRRGFDEGAVATCPKCEGEGRRLFSPVPIIFKGSGFYVTDYKKDGESGSKISDEECSKKEDTVSATKSTTEGAHGED